MPRVAGAGSRNLLLVSLLTLAGCGHAPPSSQKLLADSIRQQELGDFNAALKLAETGERSADDKDLRILFRLRRAEILLLRGKSTEARSLIPNDSPAGSEAACRARMITGWAAFLGGDMQQARVQLDEAYLNATALQNPALTARIEIRRAAVFTDSGEIAAAEASIGRALDIARQSQDELLEATALGNRGMMRLSASRFDEAIPFFERSIRLRERMGAPNARALSLLNLGYCYYRLGDFDKALELYQAARRILTELNRVADVQAVLGNIGNIHLHRKDYKTAQVYYFEALALAREVHDPTWIARWCSNLATLLIESGDYSGAKRYNNEAQAIGAKLAPSQTLRGPELNSAALASARGNYPEAIARYTSVIATEPHSPAQILDAHAGLGRTYLAMGRAEKAGAAFQETTSLLEQFRDKLSKEDYKLSYLSGLIHFHQEYVELLMSQQKTEKALEVVEASRARLLSANLGSPAGAAFRDAAAQSGASILTFWLAPSQSYVWVLTRGRITPFRIPGEEKITALVEAHSRFIQNLRDPLTSENPPGAELFKVLLGEASKLIPREGKAIIVPDGALNTLNFETLPVSSPQPHYWIEDVQLSLSPSLAVLGRAAQAPARLSSALLIGDPAGGAVALPFAAREIEVIRQRVASSNPTLFTGTAATPAAYAGAGRYRLIHFASHATANRESPLDSAVLLSGGKLYVRDIAKVPLVADLVTVSACRSAGARTYGGEGLVGFAWAFLRAGAKNVVAGLWDVNDASTARLMDDMYAGLDLGRTPAEALRSAKLHMIRSPGAYRKPYYWAPFQLYTRSPAR